MTEDTSLTPRTDALFRSFQIGVTPDDIPQEFRLRTELDLMVKHAERLEAEVSRLEEKVQRFEQSLEAENDY